MGTGYALAYGLGITPWQRNTTHADPAFDLLMDREEQHRELPFGRALDLGCGTGLYTRRLQARGWEVMGVDSARTAVNIAVRLGGDSGRYVIGDVSYLVGCGVGKDFDLFLDVGTFHGLRDAARARMGAGVTQLADTGAHLLMLAFAPNHNPLVPRGASAEDVLAAFPRWTMLDAHEADTTDMPRGMRGHAAQWFRLGLT